MTREYDIQVLPTTYDRVRFRSRIEARWAIAFDSCGLRFTHEPDGFGMRMSGAYLPDFYVPKWRAFLEVKPGEPTAEEVDKCQQLAASTGHIVLLAEGGPEERFQIHWFDPDSRRPGLFVLAHDRFGDGGFWLVGANESWPIGMDGLAIPLGGPCFAPMGAAYGAARGETFPKGRQDRRYPAVKFPFDAFNPTTPIVSLDVRQILARANARMRANQSPAA